MEATLDTPIAHIDITNGSCTLAVPRATLRLEIQKRLEKDPRVRANFVDLIRRVAERSESEAANAS